MKKEAIRKEMVELSMHQNQLADASHLLFLCSLKKVDTDYLDRMINKEKEKMVACQPLGLHQMGVECHGSGRYT